MKVIVIGAGPVGCLVAVLLRQRGAEVTLYERSSDPRVSLGRRGNSFNVTLTPRGLRGLAPQLRDRLYAAGICMPQRVVHNRDSSVRYERYGTATEHHLLSIPRQVLHWAMLDEAVQGGADVKFSHDCVRVDPVTAQVDIMHEERILRDSADLVVGCDGAGSIVRHALTRAGARLDVHQEFLPYGYIELVIPAARDGGHVLLGDPGASRSKRKEHGLHVWPRGGHMLLAQPNRDGTYTATLFMPLSDRGGGGMSFDHVRGAEDLRELMAQDFPDVAGLLQALHDEPPGPSSLRTLTCFPSHHGRALLLGDAAHTLAPFYGQGINCSFEEVHALFGMLDAADLTTALTDFSQTRRQPTATIANLSRTHLATLVSEREDPLTRARADLERELQRRYPDRFVTLYSLVAFSDLPYHEAVIRYQRHDALIKRLCRDFDPIRHREVIVDLFGQQTQPVERHGDAEEIFAAPHQAWEGL